MARAWLFAENGRREASHFSDQPKDLLLVVKFLAPIFRVRENGCADAGCSPCFERSPKWLFILQQRCGSTAMSIEIERRMEVLEQAMIESEGAQFAMRHLLSTLIAEVCKHEAQSRLVELAAGARAKGAELGEGRLRGYLDELDAIRDSIDPHNQSL